MEQEIGDLFSAFDDDSQVLTKDEEINVIEKFEEQGIRINDNKGKSAVKTDDGSQEQVKKRKVFDLDEIEEKPKVPKTELNHLKDPVDTEQVEGYVATGTQQKNLISFSALPPDFIAPVVTEKNPPAKEYPFKLDPFQQQAVDYIEKGESVLVSAHTSAGKTAVAEYAIAKSLRDKQRVIYTSPIKALSNQKYRDLQEEFGDVGLMTGDITINPTATCLIMTTEILRSMLYRGSEIMREVAWVIYDEIHYMRDKERGVVWEESIILLPHKVRFVFLSATIPNSRQFAQWICKIHMQPCHVVYTDYRPTPLQHYVFPAGGDGLHLVVDEKGKFREDNFQKAMAALSPPDELESISDGRKKGKKSKQNTGPDVFRIVKLIMEREYDPVIVFSFSKKSCEAYGLLMSKLDFNTDEEKELVEVLFRNAMDSLSDDDKKLPQVDSMLPLLKRGIGIHHGGLLPILKETVELLFGEGLLKCLFATETFSMGLNMPAKTVVFTDCKKYDGEKFRWITSGEYIQMSGRAGRRSLDARGIVIQMLEEKMEPQVAKGILYGQADPLFSTFHLGYNMLLNLLRVEDVDPEFMIRQSFHQFQNEQTAPGLQDEIDRLHQEIREMIVKDEEEVAEYYHLSKKIEKMKRTMQDIINRPVYVTPFLNPGRLVRVQDGEQKWDWGMITNFKKSTKNENTQVTVYVLINCVSKQSKSETTPTPAPFGSYNEDGYEMKVCPVSIRSIDAISSLKIYAPKELHTLDSRKAVAKALSEVSNRFKDGIPILDPIEDMGIEEEELKDAIRKAEEYQEKLVISKFHTAFDKESRFSLYHCKVETEAKIRHLEREIQQTKNLVLRDDLRRKKRVLKRLEFVNQDFVIETKGKTACEISTAHELLMTEMIFSGLLNNLSVNEMVALLSCLIFQEKSNEEDKLPLNENLHAPIRQLQDVARKIAKICQEANLSIDVDEFVDSFNPGLVDIVMAWCEGSKFSQICKMSKVFEGTIIRCIRRLDELLRQLEVAAHTLGNTELKVKFKEGSNKIKRGIVFAASLYL